MSDIRESMWDLVYGLLSDEESQALVARIKSEPDVARLYAEVRLEADLVAQAARVQDSSVVLNPNKEIGSSVTTSSAAEAMANQVNVAQVRDTSRRVVAWLAGIAATALALLVAVGLLLSQRRSQQLAIQFVATDVVTSQPMIAGLTSSIKLRTYAVDIHGEIGGAVPADVVVSLLDSAGQQRLTKAVRSNAAGEATVQIPGEVLQPGARLDIAAANASSAAQANSSAAQEKGYEGNTDIASGKDQLAQRLVANLPVQPEPQLAYYLLAEPAPQPQQPVPYSAWYMNAFSCTPAPVEAAASAATSAGALGGSGQQSSVAAANGVVNGVLEFENVQRTEPLARELADKKTQNVVGRNSATENKGQVVVAPNKPVEVAVPKQLENKPLVVTARNRGVTVAQTTVDNAAGFDQQQTPSRKGEISNQQFALPLPPEAEGLIEVDLFDKSKDAQQPADRQFVYRQPQRRLQIDAPNARPQYRPGEEVALTLRCTDESGKPAANARLGVRVWNEMAIRESGEEPVLLADALEQGVAEESQSGAAAPPPATEPQDAMKQLGQRPVAATAAAQPVVLATNREAVKKAAIDAIAEAQAARDRLLARLGRIALIMAGTVLGMLAIMALSRVAIGWRIAAPVAAIALASLLIGFIWIARGPTNRLSPLAVARSSAPSTPAALPSAPAASTSTPLAGEQHVALSDVQTRFNAIADDRRDTSASPAASAPVSAAAATPSGSPAEPTGPALASSPAAEPRGGAVAQSPMPTNERAADYDTSRATIIPSSVSQKLSQARGQLPNLQQRGGRVASSLELAKDSAHATTFQRRMSEPAGVAGATAGGALRAAPPGAPLQLSRPFGKSDALAEQLEKRAAGKPGAEAAPQSLYFNPELLTDSDGTATVRFTMPSVQSEYRVLVDALGQGRVGSRQQTIVCGDAAAK